jgi:hypothetical protein
MFEGGARTEAVGRQTRLLARVRRAVALLRREGVRVVAAILLLGLLLELLGALAGFGTPVFLAAEALAIALLLAL